MVSCVWGGGAGAPELGHAGLFTTNQVGVPCALGSSATKPEITGGVPGVVVRVTCARTCVGGDGQTSWQAQMFMNQLVTEAPNIGW